MSKKWLFFLVVNGCLMFCMPIFAQEYHVVISVSGYQIEPIKFDETSDPDIYFSFIHNGESVESSDVVRDNTVHTYGDLKSFGDYCHGINELGVDDKLVIKVFDKDYDTSLVKSFWEWIQGGLYKYVVSFEQQVELMNDSDKKYDDYDAYKQTLDDPKIKKRELELTDKVMKINNRRNNKDESELIGEATIDVSEIIEKFKKGDEKHAAVYEIKSPESSANIGKLNVVITRFDGFGASLKVKSY